MEKGSAFIPYIGHALDDTLCGKYERVVGNGNCVAFEGRTLQVPQDQARFHGPRKLAVYDSNGNLMISKQKDAA
jgi:hypothetical protein